MGVSAYAVAACARLRSDRADMRSTTDAVITDSRTTAGDRADMGAGAHTMCADVRTNAYAQDINAAAYILCAGRSAADNDYAKNKGGKDFHVILLHRASRRQPASAALGSTHRRIQACGKDTIKADIGALSTAFGASNKIVPA